MAVNFNAQASRVSLMQSQQFSAPVKSQGSMGQKTVTTESKESKGLSIAQKVGIGVGIAAVAYGTAYGIRQYQGQDLNADIVKGFNSLLEGAQELATLAQGGIQDLAASAHACFLSFFPADNKAGQGSEVVTGKGSEVVTGQGSEVVTGQGSEVVTGQGSEVVTGQGSEVVTGQGSEVPEQA